MVRQKSSHHMENGSVNSTAGSGGNGGDSRVPGTNGKNDGNKRTHPTPLQQIRQEWVLHESQQNGREQKQQQQLFFNQQYHNHKMYQQNHHRTQQQIQMQQLYPNTVATVDEPANSHQSKHQQSLVPQSLVPQPLVPQPLMPQPSKLQQSLLASSSNVNMTVTVPYSADTDSGLSSSRTLNSSDERSGSHSSAFSGSDEHVIATSPLHEQQQMQQHLAIQSFNNNGLPIWRDSNISQRVSGPMRNVDNIQSLFVPNKMTHRPIPIAHPSTFHLPSLHPPPTMQPMAGTTAIQSIPVNYYPQLNVNNVNNVEHLKASRETKKNKTQTAFIQGPTGKKNGVPVELISKSYGQVEIERMINHYQRGNNYQGHVDKQHATATEVAVQQHYQGSLRFPPQQQQKVNINWVPNLAIPPQTMLPSLGPNAQEKPIQISHFIQTNYIPVVNESNKKNIIYSSPRLPSDRSSYLLNPQQLAQGNYRPPVVVVPKLNYNHENKPVNINNISSHISMIPYGSHVNPNHGYTPSTTSVIVKNDTIYKTYSTPRPEVFANSRTPTIITIPTTKYECNGELKQIKKINYSGPPSKLHITGQSSNGVPQNLHHSEKLINLHGNYMLYPSYCQLPEKTVNTVSYTTATIQRDFDLPPPAHLNANRTSVLPEFLPNTETTNDFQMEPLDLVVKSNTQARNINATDVPLNLYSDNSNTKPDTQESINESHKYVCAKSQQLPDHVKISSVYPIVRPLKIAVPTPTISIANWMIIPPVISPTIQSHNNMSINQIALSSVNLPTISPIVKMTKLTTTSSYITTTNNLVTNTTVIPTTISIFKPTTILTNSSATVVSASISSETTPEMTTYNSSPPPPVLMPATYADTSSRTKLHHKLKKAWLQRHEWTEDLKEAGVNIDQNTSNTFLHIDDTPPVLQCEITKKRKISNTSMDNNSKVNLESSNVKFQQLNKETKTNKKIKLSNSTVRLENPDSVSEEKKEDGLMNVRIPKKRGRKPRVIEYLPLKKGEVKARFFQSVPCLNVGPKIQKCRECRIFMNKKKNEITTQEEINNILCRFYTFRRLFTNKNGEYIDAGFPDPYVDVTRDDLSVWMPNSEFPPNVLDVKVAKRILEEAGRQFCYLVKEENKSFSLLPNLREKPIAWKKAAYGVKEMCDVCLTTIFNYHWACAKCGFGVCIDCVNDRLNGSSEVPNAEKMTKKVLREKDTFLWMTCNNKQNHEVDKLMLTQIVAGDSMNQVSSNLHEMCTFLNINLECGCPNHTLPESLQSFDDKEKTTTQSDATENTGILKHFVRKRNIQLNIMCRDSLPPRTMTLEESRKLFPFNPHVWLCDGKLLRLLDPKHPTNSELFKEQWKRGQPIMVSEVNKCMTQHLWTPSSFCNDFGEYTNDLIDCASGLLVEGKTMKEFWDGFNDDTKRLKDSSGRRMLLKLKDWPMTDDFADNLPERYDDLMSALPMKDYTDRDGKLNLAARLPECFVRPDLGPKIYSAYGNVGVRDRRRKQLMSTTNLHLDVSDAVNILVYVSILPKMSDEPDSEWHIKEAYRAIVEAGCDVDMQRRAHDPNEVPGAVWHIYHARDADAIRDLLNKVSAERGETLKSNHDPIHDQCSYLDANLRGRLYNEYGVKGYSILQCLGDAIFIPAGAPHQVKNLHNCIKVAEDFVSPENLSEGFRLMDEFRNLSSSHNNHEDKLQIKNILFHAVKDALSVLIHDRQRKEEQERQKKEEQERQEKEGQSCQKK